MTIPTEDIALGGIYEGPPPFSVKVQVVCLDERWAKIIPAGWPDANHTKDIMVLKLAKWATRRIDGDPL